jgi:hypothetical protein
MHGHMNVTMHGHMNVTMHGHMNVTMHGHMNVKLKVFLITWLPPGEKFARIWKIKKH